MRHCTNGPGFFIVSNQCTREMPHGNMCEQHQPAQHKSLSQPLLHTARVFALHCLCSRVSGCQSFTPMTSLAMGSWSTSPSALPTLGIRAQGCSSAQRTINFCPYFWVGLEQIPSVADLRSLCSSFTSPPFYLCFLLSHFHLISESFVRATFSPPPSKSCWFPAHQIEEKTLDSS